MNDEDLKITAQPNKSFIALLILFVIGIIITIGYLYFLKISNSKGNTSVKKIITKVPFNNPNFWKLTHLILFFILGLLFPRSDLIVIGFGIIWELIEHTLGLTAPKIKSGGKIEYFQWWHGDPSDIIVDVLGYYIGKAAYLQLSGAQDIQLFDVGI